MERLIGTGEICRLLGVTRKTVAVWVKMGIIKPAQTANQKGERHLFTTAQVLAMALARDLKKKGFRLAAAGAVLNFLWGRTLSELEAEWRAGRTHLLCSGSMPYPWLLAPASLPLALIEAAKAQGTPTATIDTEAAYRHLAATLAANEEARRIERQAPPVIPVTGASV